MKKLLITLSFLGIFNAFGQAAIDIADLGATPIQKWWLDNPKRMNNSFVLANEVDATPYIQQAIDSLSRLSVNTNSLYLNTQIGTVLINDSYLINPTGLDPDTDIAIEVPKGISIVVNGSLHSNYDGVNIQFKGAYNTKNKIQIYHKQWLGVHDMAQWYVRSGETEPSDQHSVGVQFKNCRLNDSFIEAAGFNKGLEVLGDANGSVNNTFILGNMIQNRVGVALTSVNGGWANENIFIGGKVCFYGYSNRHSSIKVESAFLDVNGNGNKFYGTNLEGNLYLKYSIKDHKGYNFYDVRLESSIYAETIRFENKGSVLFGNIHYTIDKQSQYNDYDTSRTGTAYVQNSVRQSLQYGQGQLKLNATSNGLTVESEQGYFFEMKRDRARAKHSFDSNGTIEFNTKASTFKGAEGILMRNDTIYAKAFITH